MAGRLQREWDEFVGPGASAVDTTLTLTLGVLGGAVAPTLARAKVGRSSALILRAMALDLWGGAWVNNTRTCAQWYERPGQTDADHLKFAALHLHPIALAVLDRRQPRRVRWALANYAYLVVATAAIRAFPRRRRVLGLVLTLAGLGLDSTLGSSRAAPWFASVFYTKLLLGHASAALWSDSALSGEGFTAT